MKKFILAFLFLSFTLTGFIQAQKTDTRIDFYDAEFFLTEEEYRDALFSFKKVYDAGIKNANINYRLGICYLNIPGEKDKAIPYLENAIKDISDKYIEGNFKEVRAPKDALLFLGNAYRINNELDKAIDAYQKYIEQLNNSDEQELRYTEQQIEACNRAKESIKNPVYLKRTNLGSAYNSPLNNYNAVISGNSEAMVYMSEQKFYNAVFYVRKIGSAWSNPMNITSQIESDGDQVVTSLSYDGNTMFLAKISNFDSDIYISEYSSRVWSKSRNLGKPVNSKYFESHACLSPDGNTLYFTSNRKESVGMMDIFTSTFKDGKWSEPENLSKVVNTPMNEENPFIMNDGKTLYFSSQGHKTIGGYDIFMTQKQDDNSWSEPIALPYPVNTTDDDVFYFPLDDNNSGYMTRFENDGFGGGDLYKIEILPLQDAPVAEVSDPEVILVTEQPQENNLLDSESEIPVEESLDETELTPENLPAEEIKPEPSARYFVKPIFFDFDSDGITETSKDKLTVIAEALTEYPEIILEVRGHTDAVGSVAYNQILSERRAKSVIRYLEQNGVKTSRLKFAGFSESHPAARNSNPDGTDSKEGRQLNRRVEFKIVQSLVENVILQEVVVPAELKIE